MVTNSPGFEMRPSRALVMNELSVSKKGPSLVVERGQLAKQQEVYHRSHKVYRVWRTTGDINGLESR